MQKCEDSFQVSRNYTQDEYYPYMNSRKLIKRLEELAKESSALKPHLVPPMKALSNLVPELVNFGISVCSLFLLA